MPRPPRARVGSCQSALQQTWAIWPGLPDSGLDCSVRLLKLACSNRQKYLCKPSMCIGLLKASFWERGVCLHEDPNILEPWRTFLAHPGHVQFNARLPYVISPGMLRVYQNSQISIVVPDHDHLAALTYCREAACRIPSSGSGRERCVWLSSNPSTYLGQW